MTCVPTTAKSTASRNMPVQTTDWRRMNRSLIISIVGIRPRMIRSRLNRSYRMTPFVSWTASFGAVSTSPETTPFRSASISSCERIFSIMPLLLDDEFREIGRPDSGFLQKPVDTLRNLITQLEFSLRGSHRIDILAAEQNKDGIPDLRGAGGQFGSDGFAVHLEFEGQLQIPNVGSVREVDDEGVQVEHGARRSGL